MLKRDRRFRGRRLGAYSHPVTLDGRHASVPALRDEVLEFHDAFRPRLIRYVASLGLSSSDAEDIVQETFLALYQHLLAGKPRTNLAGWIFRVAHRGALKRRTSVHLPGGAFAESAVVAKGRSPEEEAIFRQQHQRLQRIFFSLPEMDRLCLELRSEGLKYREIAGILNISLGSVHNSLERSLHRLR